MTRLTRSPTLSKFLKKEEWNDAFAQGFNAGFNSDEKPVPDATKLRKDTEMQELLKDKARLDWLADVNNTIGSVLLPTDIVERNLHSLRAAIDEAMAINA